MGIFDRFSSKKGKGEASGKAGSGSAGKGVPKPTDNAEKKAFAAVPSGKEKPVKTQETDVTAPEKKGDKKTATATKPVTITAGSGNRIIVRPLVTEKSNRVSSLRQYIFEVQMNATKVDVRNAVHQLYGIRPTSVQISNVRGKIVRYGRTWGKTIKRRKAMVTLPEGKSIDVFSA